MDVFLSLLALLVALVGLAGCIIPGLPGPPLNYIAILLIQAAYKPFSGTFLLVWGVVTVVVVLLDYYVPVLISRRMGATREGVIGSYVGLILGMLFTPVGMVAGLILGAIIGDLVAGKEMKDAMRSGLGNALGTLLSTGFKLIVSGILTYYVIAEIFRYYN